MRKDRADFESRRDVSCECLKCNLPNEDYASRFVASWNLGISMVKCYPWVATYSILTTNMYNTSNVQEALDKLRILRGVRYIFV